MTMFIPALLIEYPSRVGMPVGAAFDVLPKLAEEDRQFDMEFIDADLKNQ
jgi:predicted O-methyltransferase YrrM